MKTIELNDGYTFKVLSNHPTAPLWNIALEKDWVQIGDWSNVSQKGEWSETAAQKFLNQYLGWALEVDPNVQAAR